MPQIGVPTKVRWNEIAKVGMPPDDLRFYPNGPNLVPRTFLCRGEWSIFTSRMYSDGSGFSEEDGDGATAWAIIDGF